MKYEIDYKKSAELEEYFKQIPSQAEEITNDYFEKTGAQAMIESIVGFIPVSKRNKKHAKTSNPLKSNLFNLGFEITHRGGALNTKGSYAYLVFPDEGRGPKNKIAHEFMTRGRDKASDQIIEDLKNKLQEKIMLGD